MNRSIKHVTVLGSGVMGSRIACHFANIGVKVLLLDIVPKSLTAVEMAKGLTEASPSFRNRIVNEALQSTLKSNPSPIYKKSLADHITTGNFEDHLSDIKHSDWIIEVVVENLEIKKNIFEAVEQYRKPGSLITSNTSGIPIHLMAEGRSDDFVKHFCGTHFFNPPRYLRLLEVIPSPGTLPEVVSFLMDYGDVYLGKNTVLCKDTPAFIANRVGVYSIMSLFHLVEKMELTVPEVDKLTGPVIGRAKSATFRTCDVVGIDTLVKVANDLYNRCPKDEARSQFQLPTYLQTMVANGWFGDKSKQGFYKKIKNAEGKSEIHALNLKTLEYQPQEKVRFAALEQSKSIENIADRLKLLLTATDKAGDFYRQSFYGLFTYCSHRIPEIADDLYLIDEAIGAGFGWDQGPFEVWDMVGLSGTLNAMKALGHAPALWIEEMVAAGNTSFYKYENGIRKCYQPSTKTYVAKGGAESIVYLQPRKANGVIWKNSGCSLIDIGEGIVNLEFHTKMNTIGGEIIQGVNKSIEIAEQQFRGLVIGNEAANFSAGANLAMILMFAIDQDWDEIDMAVRAFQGMNMRVRHSSIPVVVAPHTLTLGGGCEMTLHADKVVAAAETYIGLVEFGVGLIPGGGGSKEFALRASREYAEGIIDEQVLRDYFLTIGMAKVSTSALEAFDLKILKKGRDEVVMNRSRQITEAKRAAIELANDGYTKPALGKDIKVLGRAGMGVFFAGASVMQAGGYISKHDQLISEKLAYVMCGGDLSAKTLVTEQYLLDLEREAFVSLCGERKTLERIQAILKTGKPLRN